MAIMGFDASISFAENTVNAAPQLLDAAVTFTSSSSLIGGRLQVAGLLAEDRVSVLHQGYGAGLIAVSGSDISFGGTLVGSFTGGVGGTFTVTFAAGVTAAAVDALIQRLTYANVSDAPTATRSLTLNVADGTGTGFGGTHTALTGTANPFNGVDVGDWSKPTFVDLDGDGDLDLVVSESYGTLSAWRSGGGAAPVFTALTGADNPFNGLDVGGGAAPRLALTFVDLDGDGDLDLVSGTRYGILLAIRNIGTSAAPVFTALTGTDNPFNGIDVGWGSAPAFMDLDGDDDLDLVSGESQGTFLAWRNIGTSAAPVFTALTGSDNPFNGLDAGLSSDPVLVDLDGDGDLDFVSSGAGYSHGTFLAWRNIGSSAAPVFIELTSIDNPFNGLDVGTYSAPAFVDLDGDGKLDLVSGERYGTLLAWHNDTQALPGITVTVTAQNEAPTVTSAATASFAENGTGTAYQATGSDPDGATALSWTLGGADATLFDVDSAGAVTFKTAPNFDDPADAGGNNVYDITVVASDGLLSSATRAVAITLTNVNEAPIVMSGGTASYAENGYSTAYQAAGSDPDAGTTLTWTLGGTDAALFFLNGGGGAVWFRSDPNFEAPTDAGGDNVYDITVTASDGVLSSAARAVAITVTNMNEAPSVTSGFGTGFAENGSGVAYQATATDPDAGTALIGTLGGTDAALFDIDIAGAVTFKVVPDFDAPADDGGNNVYDITVTASDGALSSAARAVVITVTNVNEAPSVTSGATVNFVENAASIAYQAVASDPDPDNGTTLSWTLGGADAALFDIDAAGAVTFKASPDFEAPADAGGDNVYDITVTASDGVLSSAARAVAITVANMNEAPSVTSGFGTGFAENGSGVAYQATATDPDAGTALIGTLGGTDAALFDIDIAGAVTFKVMPDFEAPADDGADNVYDITVTASDGVLSSAAHLVAISVTNVNEYAPSVSSLGGADFAENGGGVVYQAAGSDADAGTTLTWTLDGADSALFDITTSGAVTFKSAPNFEAPTDTGGDNVYDITVTASDGALSSAAHAVAITVTNVNNRPIVTSAATASFAENATGTAYQAAGSDQDSGTTLTWALGGADAALFDINTATGAVTFKSSPNFEAAADSGGNNVYDITVTASDGTMTSAARDVAITVTDVNDAPIVTSGAAASFVENDTAVAYQAAGSAQDAGAALAWTLGGTDAWRFNINSLGAVTFKASPDFEVPTNSEENNVYNITVIASDGTQSSAPRAVAITVTNVSEAPVVTSGTTGSIAEKSFGVAYQATGFDSDAGTTLTWSMDGTDAALFDLNATTGAVTFKVVPVFASPSDDGGNNIYDITVTASDGALSSATRTVAISVIDRYELSGLALGVTFDENTVNVTPQLLDADVVFTGTSALNGGYLVVSGLLDEDRVSLLTLGDGPGQIGISGSTVSYGGVAIGTSAGGVGGHFTVTFNAAADQAAVDALIQRLAYANASDAPRPTRSLTLDVVDGAGFGMGGSLEDVNPFNGIDVGFDSKPAFVDLDGDGDLDLISGNSIGTLLAWRNDGPASAPVFTALSGSANPFNGIDVGATSTPAFVDLDGDGDLDLVSGETNGTLLAWRNTGTESAPVFTSLSGSANPFNGFDVRYDSAPAFVDLDGDGDLDLVSGEWRGTMLAWRNDGPASSPVFTALSGSADPLYGIRAGLLNSTPAFVDLDGDGDLDLVSGENFGTLLAWRNTGTASVPFFTALSGSDNPFNGIDVGFFSTPAFVDLDGDGKLDLVSGTSDGTLLAWLVTGANPLPQITVTVAAQNDAPLRGPADTTVSFVENSPLNVFQATASDTDSMTFSWTLGGADAALFDVSSTGTVTFKTAPDFDAPADNGGDNVYDITVTASDGFLSAEAQSVTITVTNLVERHTLGGFGPGVVFAENAVNAAPQLLDANVVFSSETSLMGGRLVGGRLVVGGLLAEDQVTVLHQGNAAGEIGVSGSTVSYGGVSIGTTSGGVGTSFTVTFTPAATGAAVDALIQRLAYTNVSDTPTAARSLTLDVVNGAGQGLSFGLPIAMTGTANPFNGIDVGFASAPAFVDMNGDGKLDLVSGTLDGTLLTWRNSGTNAAPVLTALTGSANPFNGIDVGYNSMPAFVDLDGDGDLDLVAGAYDGTLRMWHNTGTSASPVFVQQTGGNNPFSGLHVPASGAPAFVDVDGDGDLDLVSGEDFGTLLAWRNIGSSVAPVFIALTGTANPFNGLDVGRYSTPTFVDLDGDSDLDLVSGETNGALLAWRSSGGANPIFTALTGTDNPFSGLDVGRLSIPAFLDLDADGDLDLVSGGYDGNLLAWRNTGTNLSPSIAVTVTTQNDAPSVTSAASANLAENAGGIAYQAAGSDPEGITLSWVVGGTDAALFNINGATGAVSFKVAPDFESPADNGADNVYDITVTASDGLLNSAARAVAITVTNVAEAPSVTSGATASFAENDSGTAYQATGSDPEGVTPGWTLGGTDAALFDINAATGAVSFKTAPDFETPADDGADNVYDITVTASDGVLNSAARAVAISVINVNEDAPSIGSGGTASVTENSAGTAYQAVGADQDAGTTIAWTLGGADAAQFDIDAAGAVTFKTAPNFEAPADTGGDNVYDITVTASDGALSSAPLAVAITVTGVAEAPVISSAVTGSLAEDATGTAYQAVASDPEGSLVTWVLGGTDAALFDMDTNSAVTFKTVPDFEAPADAGGDNVYDITVTASDGVLHSAARAVVITVTNVNEAPSVSSGATASVVENATSIAYQAVASDPDAGTTFSWTLSGADAALFDIDAAGGVTFKAAPDFEAPADAGGDNVYDITVTASDGELGSAASAIAITVTNVDEQPILTGFGPSVAFDENTANATPQLLDADAVFTAGASLSGGRLEVSGLLAEDRVSVLNQGNGVREIGVSGSAVSYGDVTIGTASGGIGATFTVAFNSNVTSAAVDALIERLAYGNVSDTPTATRSLSLNVVDGTGAHLSVNEGIGTLTQLTGTANPFSGIDVGYTSTPAFVDLDGDGDLDLVSGNNSGTLMAWRNTGTVSLPVFTALTGPANPFNGIDVGSYSTPAFVDLDGEAKLDLVSGELNGTLLAWRNTGTASQPVFNALTDTANPFNGIDAGFTGTPAFVDLDGDRDLDLVSGNNIGTLMAWRNTGTASLPVFTALSDTANPFNGIDVGYSTAPAFVDLDGDGKLDLFTGVTDGTLLAWRNTGTSAAPVFTALTGTDHPFNGIDVGQQSRPAFVDLDGDGNLDLVLGERYGTLLAWHNPVALPKITVTVIAQNDTPDITSGATASFAENGSGTAYQALGSDRDGAITLIWTLGGADAAQFDIDAAGAVTFKTAPNFEAPADAGGNNVYDFTVTASDGVLSSAAQAVTISVTDANDNAPSTSSGGAASFAENGTGTAYQAAGSDQDAGTTLIWTLGGTDAAQFDIDAAGAVTFKALPNFEALADAGGNNVYDITVTASDGALSSAPRAVAITVTDVAEAPIVTSGITSNFAENATGIAYQAVGSDQDAGTTLIWTLGGSDAGLFNIASLGVVTFQAVPDFESPSDDDRNNVYDITVTASDGVLSSAARTVAITVTNVNEAPNVTSAITASLAENAAGVAYQATASDPDAGATITWTLGGTDAARFAIDAGGAVTFKVSPNFEAPNDSGVNNVYDITVTASDGALSSPARVVAIAVTNVNEAPSVTSAATAMIVENDTAIAYQAIGFDPDAGAIITWTLGGTDSVLFNINSLGAVTFKTAPNFEAPADAGGNNVYDITITASDGALSSAARAVAITVTNLAEGPILTGLAPAVVFAENTVNAAPQLLDADVIFTNESSLSSGRLVVTGLLAADRVSVLNLGNGVGEIGVTGSTISYGGVAIGTASGGAGATFTVTFNGNATGEAVNALIERLAYGNVSDVPTATRTLTLDVFDGTGKGMGGKLDVLTGAASPFNGFDVGDRSAPALVDMDGDGDADLVAGGWLGAFLAWRNIGSGAAPAFTPLTGTDNPFNGLTAGNASAPSFVDLDADGDLDLVSGSSSSGLLAWRNIGSSAAPAFTRLTGTDNPFNGFNVGFQSKPTFVDLDGDGDLDLVSGEYFGTLLAWRNIGTGAAPVFTALTGSANPFNGIDVGFFSSPAFVDLDGDGDLDLLVGEGNGTFLAWRNTGTSAGPGFTALTGTDNPFNGYDVGLLSAPAFADLDGDGDPDLASGEAFGSLVAGRNSSIPLPRITITVTTQNDVPTVSSGASAHFAENATGLVYQATGSDPEGASLTWTLGGADAALFDIDAAGAVTFKAVPAFEAPTDHGGDNVYDIIVTASDGVLDSAAHAVAITVTNVNEAPSVTSAATASLAENTVGVIYQAAASDPDAGATITWTLGGSDAVRFDIDTAGAVTFKASPNFEAPTDSGFNNVYDITVTASDGTLSSAPSAVAITVTNVNEAPSVTSGATAGFVETAVNPAYRAIGSDPDGVTTLTWTLGGTDAALFNIGNAGAVTFKAAPSFDAPADDGGNNVYDITVTASDSALTSAAQAVAITVTAAPVRGTLSGFAVSVTFAENTVNATPQLLDADVVFTNATALDGGRLVVSALLAEDRISVLNQGDGVAEIGVLGSAVSYGGVTIGIAAGGIGDTFTVTFNAVATAAAVDALIQRLAYANASNAPTAMRSLTIDAVDGAGQGLALGKAVGIDTLTALTGAANPFNGFNVGFASAPTFLDLDGDGDLDLVSGEGRGSLLAWRNTGTAAAPVFTALTGTANPFNGLDVGRYSTPTFVDLDGDGDLDLVSGEFNGTLLAWRNTGTASAPVFTALSGTDNPFNGIDVGLFSAPAFADMDGDGDLDLVSGEEYGGILAWRNTGTAAAPVFTELSGSDNPFPGLVDGAYYSTPAFVDLDGDGDLDLVSGKYYSVDNEDYGRLVAWRNTGTSAAPVFTALTGTDNSFDGIDVGRQSTPSFVDLDGDGDLDLVLGDIYGSFLALRNAAPLPGITVTVTAENDPPAVTSGGTANFAENASGVAYQASATDPDGAATLTWALAGTDAALFDMDSVTGAVSFKVAPDFEAPTDAGGNNVYDITVTASDGALTSAARAVAITVADVTDLNGLAASVTFANPTVNAVARILDAHVVFTSVTSLIGGRLEVTGLLAEDRLSVLNEGDAAGEIGVSGTRVSYGGVSIGTASGGVGTSFIVTFNANVTTAAVDALIQRLAYGNVSDAATETRSLTINVVDSAGKGLGGDISTLTSLTGAANPFNGFDLAYWSTPTFVDLDGDGDLDLVLGNDDGTLLAWRNTGTASAPVFTALTGTDNPFDGFDVGYHSAPTFVDLDGDGDLDLLSGELYGTILAWRNTGSSLAPVFAALTGTENPFDGFDVGYHSAPTFVDLDGDGCLDFVAGEYLGTLQAWRNTGSTAVPVFTPLSGTSNPFNAIDVGRRITPAFVDLDGDGDLDLVSGAQTGTFLAWRNTGSSAAPVFTPLIGSNNPFNTFDVGSLSAPAFADLDGEGDLDLLSGTFDGRLLVWRNTTPPLPSITVTLTNPPTVTSAATASFAENATGIAYQAAGSDPDGSTLTWSLSGTDAGLFDISSDTGAITFNAPPNFEAPADAGRNNVYDITVTASDGHLSSQAHAVAITVTDIPDGVNRAGTSGPDRLTGTTFDDRLDGGEGNDTLYGGAGTDTLEGRLGNDLLDGGLGVDSMEGGTGNDRFIVDNPNDVVVELAGEGYDRIITSLSWTLGAELEGLSLSGTADLNGTGNALANRLDGNAGVNILDGGEGSDTIFGLASDDTLIGGGGADLLDGGLGADSMEGGTGDDRYIVDSLNDMAVEQAGEGYDRVIASLSHTLDAELEGLSLSGTANLNGTGNALANRLDGNAGVNILDGGEGSDTIYGLASDDTLIGGGGADLLDGGLGADRMAGGTGNDRYMVDSIGDVAVELAGGGYDRIITALASTLGAELEGLTLTGAGDVNGTGNALANRLDGNAGVNILDGGEGHDTLVGLSGNDTLIGGGGADLLEGGPGADSMTGGLGADRFVFRSAAEANGDVISDFSVAQGDRIDLRPIDTDPRLAGDQAFVWIGGAGFDGVAGLLRLASGVLEGDVNGDGDADFQIGLGAVASLTAANIWL